MTDKIRKNAEDVLNNPEGRTWLTVHNAIIDMRRNAEDGDENLLKKFLDHHDSMVVSATLYALIHVYKPIPGLFELLLQFAGGDSRDNGEMPIQTQAIEGLLLYARDDNRSITKLLEVADKASTASAPRMCAWRSLAQLFDYPWDGKCTDEMLWSPDSARSEEIRNEIWEVVKERKGIPVPE